MHTLFCLPLSSEEIPTISPTVVHYMDLNDPISGTTYTTIQKATQQDHGTDVGWSDDYGDGVALFNWIFVEQPYYIIDGVVGGGPGGWKSGHGIEVYSESSGDALIYLAQDVHHIEVRHVQAHATRDTKITGLKGTLLGNHNIYVRYSYIHTLFSAIIHMQGWEDSLIEYSYFADNKNTPDWHSEAISYFGDCVNITLRHNIWYNIEGSGFIAGVNAGSASNWSVYGNVFSNSDSPVIAVYYGGTDSNSMSGLSFYNNIINGLDTSQGGIYIEYDFNNSAYNNLWYRNVMNIIDIAATHDYNWFYNNTRIEDCDPPCNLDTNAVASEPHAQQGTVNPFVSWDGASDPADYDFHLSVHTAAGKVLPYPYNYDMLGVQRGVDGTWDRGVLQFTRSSSTTKSASTVASSTSLRLPPQLLLRPQQPPLLHQ